MSEHFIERWECGHVASQCRCASPEKQRLTRLGLCPSCTAEAQGAAYPATYTILELLDFTKIPVARRAEGLRQFGNFLQEVQPQLDELARVAGKMAGDIHIGFEWTDLGPDHDPIVGLAPLPPGSRLN